MATLQDILALLKNMRDTKVETGRVGMDAMKYQGDKYKQVGDRINNMVGTWVGRAEKQADRGLAASEGAANRELKEREMDEERRWRDDQLILDAGEKKATREWQSQRDKDAASMEEKIARIRAAAESAGGGGREKDMGFASYMETLTDLGTEFPEGLDANGKFNYAAAKTKADEYLSWYKNMLDSYVSRNILSQAEAAMYMSRLRGELKGAGGGGPPPSSDETQPPPGPLNNKREPQFLETGLRNPRYNPNIGEPVQQSPADIFRSLR